MSTLNSLARVLALDGMTRNERSARPFGFGDRGCVPSHKIIQYLLELQRRGNAPSVYTKNPKR